MGRGGGGGGGGGGLGGGGGGVEGVDEPLYERAEGRSLMDWSARAGLSQGGFEAARELLRQAPESARRHLRVLVHGEDLQLHWPLAIVAAKRVA